MGIYFGPHWFWYRSRSWPLTFSISAPLLLRFYCVSVETHCIADVLPHFDVEFCLPVEVSSSGPEAVCSLLNGLNDDSGILSWLVFFLKKKKTFAVSLNLPTVSHQQHPRRCCGASAFRHCDRSPLGVKVTSSSWLRMGNGVQGRLGSKLHFPHQVWS